MPLDFFEHDPEKRYYFVPMHNLDIRADNFEISDNIKIWKIENEVMDSLKQIYAHYPPVAALFSDLKYILVMAIDPHPNPAVEDAKEMICYTIDTLRLFKRGDVIRGGLYVFNLSEKQNSQKKIQRIDYEPHGIYSENKYVLEPKNEHSIKQLFSNVQEIKRNDECEYLDRSIKRFSNVVENKELSEKILDCVISLETLLCPGNTESSLRFSQRTAILFGENDTEVTDYFNFFQNCYDIRSGLVHGSGIRDKSLGNMSEKEMADQLECACRRIIQIMIFFQTHNKNQNQKKIIDCIDKFLLNKELLESFRRDVLENLRL